MKSVYYIRNVDEQGRLCIPRDVLRMTGIANKTYTKLTLDDDNRIIIEKFREEGSCIFCGSDKNIFYFSGNIVCEKCKKELSKECQ